MPDIIKNITSFLSLLMVLFILYIYLTSAGDIQDFLSKLFVPFFILLLVLILFLEKRGGLL